MEISLFYGMMSKHPVNSSLDHVVELIRKDANLASLTEAYRQTGDKSHKHAATLFAVACTFEGGKGIANILQITRLSLVDFDHVEVTDVLLSKVRLDPHTLLCYITMSGKGLRVIYRYDSTEENALTYYQKAYAMGNDYYERLTGKEADPQCKNITRLSGLAFDPDVYFNPDAIAFTAEEINSFHAAHIKQGQHQKKLERIDAYFTNIIQPKLQSDGIRYEPGNHNDYVMRVGYMLAKKRYAKADAIEWAVKKFTEYDGVEQVFKSCYQNTQRPNTAGKDGGGNGNGGGRGGGNGGNRFASVDEIKDFLDGHIHLRYNLITCRYECLVSGERRGKGEESGAKGGERWQVLLDRNVNSLWSIMSSTTKVSKQDMLNVIESDYTPAFHPLKEYLESLPPWHEGDPDYIGELADTVRVKGELFPFHASLKKWLVGMVAGWIDDEAVNNVILVFIGRQGAYKTTWFNHLLPPELKQYFYTKTNAKRMSKDDLIALSQNALVCCEELDTMSPSELNQLKAAVTMEYINERAAYAHYAEQRKHINTFCGTGNNPQFLSDPTGNRRWLPYEVESIVSPREHPFNHQGIYSQAYALYKSGYRYWFTDEEIACQNQHNEAFEAPHLESELVDLYFRIPTEAETGEFVSVARAMQLISCNISQKLSAVKISKAFSDLGFKKHRNKSCRGFIAIIRSSEDIKRYQATIAIEADDRPF